MRKFALILLGIILIGTCIGYVAWRMDQNPDLLQTYERAITGASESASVPTSEATPDAANDGEAPSASVRKRGEPRAAPLDVLQMGLDFGNIVVGLIGIWLAISGLRARANS